MYEADKKEEYKEKARKPRRKEGRDEESGKEGEGKEDRREERDYVNLPYMKSVRPEDIEDVSEQYVPLFAEERDSDRVKRVHIDGGDTPFFLVSLIEHKTSPDYNVCMQVFRYMVYIWEAYEREAEGIQKGMAKREGFQYPPVLPIVYYEGARSWNVPRDFLSRIREGSAFGKYLPNFEYYLVPLRDFSNEMLMEKRDEISQAA